MDGSGIQLGIEINHLPENKGLSEAESDKQTLRVSSRMRRCEKESKRFSLVGSMYQTFYPHTLGAGMAHRARMCHIGAIGAWLIDRRCQGAGNPGAGEWRDGNWAGGGANKVDGGAKSPEKLWRA